MWTQNLRPFVSVVARLVGYPFDALDWSAFEAGLPDTDSEQGNWFVYPFGPSEQSPSVAVAYEPGADEMVSVRVLAVGPEVIREVVLLGDICRDYHLTDAHGPMSL